MSNAKAEVQQSLNQSDSWAVLRLPAPVFNISISGTWAGTITVQRSFDGINWYDVEQYTSNVQKVGEDPEEDIDYRIGFKAGDYTSGTAIVRISQ